MGQGLIGKYFVIKWCVRGKMTVKSFEDLDVWKKSIDLVAYIYKIIKFLPREELYGLSDQIRRSAISIPSNIAEGHQRLSTKEYIRFLSIARGSLGELKTQIIICVRLGYLNQEQADVILINCDQIGRMLQGLIKSLYNRQNADSDPKSPAPGPLL